MTEAEKIALADKICQQIKWANDTCEHTYRMFVKNNGCIHYDNEHPASASINMATYQMTMNPVMIAEEILQILTDAKSNGEGETAEDICKRYQLPKPRFGGGGLNSIVSTFKLFLTLHEIGHYLYSPSSDLTMQYYKAYCSEVATPSGAKMKPPLQLACVINNVIEDDFIQQEFRKEYPGRRYNTAFTFGQLYGQGNIELYGNHIKTEEKITIHNKLYYFILRGYNEYNADVLNMWNCPEKLGWSKETVEAFDLAQTFTQKERRLKYVMETVVPLAMEDLLEEVESEGNQQNGGNGDLMSQDKLRVSNQNSKGESGDAGDEGDEGDTGGESDKGDQPKESPRSLSSSKGADGDKPENATKSGDSNQSQSDKADKSGDADKAKSLEERLKDFEKELKEACDEINKHLNEDKQREETPQEVIKASNKNIAKRQMDSIGCSLRNTEGGQSYNLDSNTMRLYESCSASFSKLYNVEDYTIHRLEQGDVDPATMIEWYTEKNHQIYSVDVKANQGRTFQIIFILDMSGSMGQRFIASAQVIAAMAHAMDDVRIPSAIYVFDDTSYQVKRLDDPITLEGGESSVFNALMNSVDNGSTDPSGCFEALVYDTTYQTEDTKIVFFLTDGCMDGPSVEQTIQSDITELTERGDWYFMCIGIDFNQDDLNRLSSFTKPAICRSYSRTQIVDRLGEDIYNIITENFIKIN